MLSGPGTAMFAELPGHGFEEHCNAALYRKQPRASVVAFGGKQARSGA